MLTLPQISIIDYKHRIITNIEWLQTMKHCKKHSVNPKEYHCIQIITTEVISWYKNGFDLLQGLDYTELIQKKSILIYNLIPPLYVTFPYLWTLTQNVQSPHNIENKLDELNTRLTHLGELRDCCTLCLTEAWLTHMTVSSNPRACLFTGSTAWHLRARLELEGSIQ